MAGNWDDGLVVFQLSRYLSGQLCELEGDELLNVTLERNSYVELSQPVQAFMDSLRTISYR